MFKRNASSFKKDVLLARKEKLLQDLKYYEKRINEFPTNNPSFYYGGNSSSDSEDDLPALLNVGPSIPQLKSEQQALRTCLNATQELTSLEVLQAENNVLVQDPDLDGEKPVSEPGSWKEVIAECRIDHIPFSITFLTHQPSRKFGPTSFRGLRVAPVKKAHGCELSNTILSSVSRPSDAIEVLRSYAVAYRSRRTTLARLVDNFANKLFIEPSLEGGFILKCPNLLEMVWRLDNRTSPMAPFQHKMKFELEYMDESFLEIVKHAHKQLSDPSLMTDERTQLLAKIINTCLEAHAPTQELYESMESDQESLKKLEKTTLDTDDDLDEQVPSRERAAEVMAPPKSLPKKAKPKGKENVDENRKSVKRSISQVEGSVKRAKTITEMVLSKETEERNEAAVNEKGNESTKNKVAGKGTVNRSENTNESTKNKVVARSTNENHVKTNESIKSKIVAKSGEKQEKAKDNNVKKKDKLASNNDGEKKGNDGKNVAKSNTDKGKGDEINDEVATKNDGAGKNIVKSTKRIEKNEQNNGKVKASKNVNTGKNPTQVTKHSGKTNEINDQATNNEGACKTNNTKTIAKIVKRPDNTKQTGKDDVTKLDKASNDTEAKGKTKAGNDKAKRDVNTEHKLPSKTVTDIPKDTNKIIKQHQKGLHENAHTEKLTENVTTKNVKRTTEVKTKNDNQEKKEEKIEKPKNFKNVQNAKPNEGNKSKPNDPTSNNDKLDFNKKNIEGKKNSENNTKIAKNNDDTERPIMVPPNIEVQKGVTKKDNVKSDPKKALPKNFAKTVHQENMPKNKEAKAKNQENRLNDLEITAKNQENISKNQENKPKNQAKIKPKPFKNLSHRNPNTKLKNLLKPNISSESGKVTKIPQKKLSPAYAAVLQQNPLRMSPRMTSKLKSSSDSNIQAKLFKPVTNIPRLLKKPAPKSK